MGRSHTRCALLRCAGKRFLVFTSATTQSHAQRMCERPLKPVGRFTHNTIKLYKLRGVLIGRIALAKQNARQCLQYSRLTGITH